MQSLPPSLYQIQVMSVPFPYRRVKRAIFQFTRAPTASAVCAEPTPGTWHTTGFQTLKQNHLSTLEFQVSRLWGGGTDVYF